jgi:hypothetical protein
MKWLLSLVLVLLAVGTLRVSGCGGDECGGCDDGNPCTHDRCDSYRVGEPPGMCEPDEREIRYRCVYPQKADGTSCGGGNVCVGGQCTENLCAECEDDGNSCTDDCSYETGECNYTPRPDNEACYNRAGECLSGYCCTDDPPPCDDDNECTVDCKVAETGECIFISKPNGRRCGYDEPYGLCVEGTCRVECEYDDCVERMRWWDGACLTGECLPVPEPLNGPRFYCDYLSNGEACGDGGSCIDGFCQK